MKTPRGDGQDEILFSCPLLSPEEFEAVSVPMSSVEDPENGVKAILDEYGYCIVTNVLSTEKCKALEDTMSQEMLSLVDTEKQGFQEQQQAQMKHQSNNDGDNGKGGPQNPDAKSSRKMRQQLLRQQVWEKVQKEGVRAWPNGTLEKMGTLHHLQLRGLPHTQFAWDCRRDENVRKVYQTIYASQQETSSHHHDGPDLVTSCDNSFLCNASTPKQEQVEAWPHVDINDRNTTVSQWDVYQGVLYIWSSESDHSSTTVIWPKSHLLDVYQSYLNDENVIARGSQAEHFTRIHYMSHSRDQGYRDEMMDGWLKHARRITVPAGGLLVWSSRTTHQGWVGGPRLAQPVCWEPKSRRSEAAKHRKWALAALGLPSTHWASLGQPHFFIESNKFNGPPPTVDIDDDMDENEDPAQLVLDPDRVVFALKSYLKSVALKDNVNPQDMWDKFTGLIKKDQDLPSDAVALLEESLKDEYKAIL